MQPFKFVGSGSRKASRTSYSSELQRVKERLKLLKREAEEFLDNMQIFSLPVFQRLFVNHHAVLKHRKDQEEESIDEDEIDFKRIIGALIYLLRKTFLQNLLQLFF